MKKKNVKIKKFGNHVLNNTLINDKKLTSFQKCAYYFLILLLLAFIFLFITILILLIRKRIRKMYEKMRRLKLQQEINKIMRIDIFENRSPNFDTNNSGFQSLSNDSTLAEIGPSNSVLSEINIQNDRNSKNDD